MIVDGYTLVPEAPGLGFGELVEAALRERMDSARPGGYFDASDLWDSERSHDRLWS